METPSKQEALAVLLAMAINDGAAEDGFEKAMEQFMKAKASPHISQEEEDGDMFILGDQCAKCTYEQFMKRAERLMPELWRVTGH